MFLRFARTISKTLGNPYTFFISIVFILVWFLSGPFFNYDNRWQLIINSSTTILTFLIVVILQHQGNHDAEMLDSKLNQIIALLNKDKLSKEEKRILDEHHEDLIELALEEAAEENGSSE